MASRDYCSSASLELGMLRDKLHGLSNKIDHIPSIDKYKMFSQIQELNIIITELDDRIEQLTSSCSMVEQLGAGKKANPVRDQRVRVSQKTNEFFDYEFGG
jgi:hypothetical protein